MTGPSARVGTATLMLPGGRTCLLETIREPADQLAVAAVAERLAAMEPWRRYPYPAREIADYLMGIEPDAPRYLIRQHQHTLGVLGLRLNWLRGPYVQLLGVLPHAQGQGVGGAVIAWLEALARDRGARNMFVLASAFNERALAFYEQHGFKQVAELPDLVVDGINEIMLRKRLG